jgi:hypothetical protein
MKAIFGKCSYIAERAMIFSVSRESFEESTSHLFHQSHLLQSLNYLAS